MFDCIETGAQTVYVAPQMLPRWAERVRPHFEKMARGSSGRYLYTDLLTEVAAGRMQLWLAIDGASLLCVMLTEVKTFPRSRELWLIGLVGSRPRRWAHLLMGIEAVAKQNFGCAKIVALHLPRFRTLLPGYELTHWMSEKELV